MFGLGGGGWDLGHCGHALCSFVVWLGCLAAKMMEGGSRFVPWFLDEISFSLFLGFGCLLNGALSQTLTHPTIEIIAAECCQGFFQGLVLEF